MHNFSLNTIVQFFSISLLIAQLLFFVQLTTYIQNSIIWDSNCIKIIPQKTNQVNRTLVLSPRPCSGHASQRGGTSGRRQNLSPANTPGTFSQIRQTFPCISKPIARYFTNSKPQRQPQPKYTGFFSMLLNKGKKLPSTNTSRTLSHITNSRQNTPDFSQCC